MVHCVAISRRELEVPFPEISPPAQRVSLLRQRLHENGKATGEIQEAITAATGYARALSGKEQELEKEIRFRQVVSGMGSEGAIRYVTGFIPVDREESLVAEARKRHWGILTADPSELDTVPTLLRNPRWASLIEPVLRLLGLSPGYHELDVSPLFLIFFSLFFGILIGDAGYGLVYLVLTFVIATWLRKMDRMTPELSTIITLFYLLSTCAIIWGTLTGTFFGQEWLRSLGYQPPMPQLNDAATMETFCFFLGALHLTIAHAWRITLKYPSPTALADAGYICILWTAFFLARTLILGEPFPALGWWLVGIGVLLVVLFTNPQRNVLRGIGEGLGTIALSFMNNITDVISYVRLFAVGLATLAIAETTNMLATAFGTGIIAVVAGIAILIIGHTLNIILGPMSVLVHGIRLNVLEFSGHANVTWSGVAFEPLQE
jgi:V/A-type H+-transporting ATPase subunit I